MLIEVHFKLVYKDHFVDGYSEQFEFVNEIDEAGFDYQSAIENLYPDENVEIIGFMDEDGNSWN